MSIVPTLVLPGLDGTRPLRQNFCDSAPPAFDVRLLELPPDLGTYAELVQHFARELDPVPGGILIAESFAGPFAVMLAAQHLQTLSTLVLVATFVTSPAPSLLRRLPWSLLVRVPIPSWAIRLAMLDRTCSRQMVDQLQRALRTLPPDVLACRIREVLSTDVRDACVKLPCRVLYVQALRDPILPQRCVDEIRQLRPDAAIESIDGPHTLLECRPGEVWQTIADFTGPSPSDEPAVG